jgi:hypothetical protein
MQRKRLDILLSGSEGSLGRGCRAIDIFPTLAFGRDASTATCDSKKRELLSSVLASDQSLGLPSRREKREERRDWFPAGLHAGPLGVQWISHPQRFVIFGRVTGYTEWTAGVMPS